MIYLVVRRLKGLHLRSCVWLLITFAASFEFSLGGTESTFCLYFEKKKKMKQSWLPAFWKERSKTHEILKITLFNWTKQDKTCKFSRKSSFSSYVQHKNRRKQQQQKTINWLNLCQLDVRRLAERKGRETRKEKGISLACMSNHHINKPCKKTKKQLRRNFLLFGREGVENQLFFSVSSLSQLWPGIHNNWPDESFPFS